MSEVSKGQENKASGDGKQASQDIVLQADALDRFVTSFEASARRWELVVYPALLGFIVLAAYGFFLIYNLSRDLSTMAQGMDPDMGQHLTDISSSVAYLSENVRTMTRRIDRMTNTIEDISVKMDALDTMAPMLTSIRGMNASMGAMTVTTDQMRGEMTYMGRSISRPMNKIDSFMPW